MTGVRWQRFAPRINAHDHLELNHYPRTRYQPVYSSAHDWGEQVSARLDDPPLGPLRQFPLGDRLFIGGLKNLLCGALIVAHHNPPHRVLFRRGYPVDVVRRYHWAHSLHFSTAEALRRFAQAAPGQPRIIHLAEGTDAAAAAEYDRLRAAGGISRDTVLVHGVGLSAAQIAHGARACAGLVWCPTTNAFLLGATADIERWLAEGGRLALGSDSRLTADGDWLDELRAARALAPAHIAARLWECADAAAMLGLRAPDDTHSIVLADGIPERRAHIALVVRRGRPQIGDPAAWDAHFPAARWVEARLDGQPKRIAPGLARRIAACPLKEPGLEIDEHGARRARWFDLRYT